MAAAEAYASTRYNSLNVLTKLIEVNIPVHAFWDVNYVKSGIKKSSTVRRYIDGHEDGARFQLRLTFVNAPPPKGGGFRLRLKAGSVRRSADLA